MVEKKTKDIEKEIEVPIAEGLCPECKHQMQKKGNKFICKGCGLQIEPKIK